MWGLLITSSCRINHRRTATDGQGTEKILFAIIVLVIYTRNYSAHPRKPDDHTSLRCQ